MSIVLDFVERLVLQKAFEFTQCAAYRMLEKCIKLEEANCKQTTKRSEIPIKGQLPEPPEIKVPKSPMKLIMPELPAKPLMPDVYIYDERDLPRNNSGLIDPPQMSCMRVCRDSYFS